MKRSHIGYNWKDLNEMGDEELRKTYRRESRRAREAYKQMNDAYPNLAELRTHRGDFKTLGELGNITRYQLEQELMLTQNYLKSDFADIERYQEYKRKSLATLHAKDENGEPLYGNVTEENFEQFGNYMKSLRDKGLVSEASSDYIAELFGQFDNKKVISRIAKARREKVSDEVIQANLKYWSENAENLERLYFSKKRGGGSGNYQ